MLHDCLRTISADCRGLIEDGLFLERFGNIAFGYRALTFNDRTSSLNSKFHLQLLNQQSMDL